MIMETPSTLILLHNPFGIRVEFDVQEKCLQIWISPMAGRSSEQWIRDFSNRDDHTRLFDRITVEIPGEFTNTLSWEPNYAALQYNGNKLHIAVMEDAPTVLLWSESECAVNFKSDKSDYALERDPLVFALRHVERGLDLTFCAALNSQKEGRFRHQLVLQPTRSIYARAELSPGQTLAITGETSEMPVMDWIRNATRVEPLAIAHQAVMAADRATLPGRPELVGLDGLQVILEKGRRTLHCATDRSGCIRAAFKHIYYMTWVRDGGFVNAYRAYAGESTPVGMWCDYHLRYPTLVDEPGVPKGHMFGQLVAPLINKLEEDGTFFATWSAFTHWTQTGELTYLQGSWRKTLTESQNWLDAYCRREGRFGFTRRYYCEVELIGSRDYGYDNAVGFPIAYRRTHWQGNAVTAADDIYINTIAYSTCRMLEASAENETEANDWGQRAESLRVRLKQLRGDGALPNYGEVLTEDGRWIWTPPYGMDREDFVWGLCATPFSYGLLELVGIRKKLLDDLLTKPSGWFVCSYGALLTACDTAWEDEERIVRALEYIRPQCERAGDFLPMPGSVVEIVDVKDGDRYHDVRPQMFSISALLAAVSNLGLRRLPFGLAVRPTLRISKINHYEWRGGTISLTWEGKGNSIAFLEVDGTKVEGSWQLPENLLGSGTHQVRIVRGEPVKGAVLISSTVRLESCDRNHWELTAFGHNEVVLRGYQTDPELKDASGNSIPIHIERSGNDLAVTWNGRGRYSLR